MEPVVPSSPVPPSIQVLIADIAMVDEASRPSSTSFHPNSSRGSSSRRERWEKKEEEKKKGVDFSRSPRVPRCLLI